MENQPKKYKKEKNWPRIFTLVLCGDKNNLRRPKQRLIYTIYVRTNELNRDICVNVWK